MGKRLICRTTRSIGRSTLYFETENNRGIEFIVTHNNDEVILKATGDELYNHIVNNYKVTSGDELRDTPVLSRLSLECIRRDYDSWREMIDFNPGTRMEIGGQEEFPRVLIYSVTEDEQSPDSMNEFLTKLLGSFKEDSLGKLTFVGPCKNEVGYAFSDDLLNKYRYEDYKIDWKNMKDCETPKVNAQGEYNPKAVFNRNDKLVELANCAIIQWDCVSIKLASILNELSHNGVGFLVINLDGQIVEKHNDDVFDRWLK